MIFKIPLSQHSGLCPAAASTTCPWVAWWYGQLELPWPLAATLLPRSVLYYRPRMNSSLLCILGTGHAIDGQLRDRINCSRLYAGEARRDQGLATSHTQAWSKSFSPLQLCLRQQALPDPKVHPLYLPSPGYRMAHQQQNWPHRPTPSAALAPGSQIHLQRYQPDRLPLPDFQLYPEPSCAFARRPPEVDHPAPAQLWVSNLSGWRFTKRILSVHPPTKSR